MMAQLKIPTEVSEHCLGHVFGLIRKTYDRHEYLLEKQEAFEKLTSLVERIVNPPATDNVVPLRKADPQ